MTVFNQIKEIPMDDVLKKYLPELILTEYEDYMTAVCPFHKDNNPSFTVYPETNSWYCFGCGLGGSVIDLVMNARKLESWDAVLELARSWEITIHEFTPEEKAKYEEFSRKQELLAEYIESAHNLLEKEQREALHGRGLTDEIIDEYKIGYDPSDKAKNHEVAQAIGLIGNGGGYLPNGRIVIPVFQYGKPVFQYGKPVFAMFWDYRRRQDLPKYLFLNGWEKPLAGSDLVRRDKPVYVVEGIFDYFPLVMNGYDAVCALGTKINKDKQALLNKAEHIYLLFDNDSQKEDNPGQAAALELLEEMFPKAKNIQLPEGSDPNDIFTKDPQGFKAYLDKLTGQAKNALELELDNLNAISPETLKSPESRELIQAQIEKILPFVARLGSKIEKDMYLSQVHQILKPAGITKQSLQKELNTTTKKIEKEDSIGDDESQQDTLIRLAGGAYLFKDNVREPYARIEFDGHEEIWRISSENFKHWLIYQYYDETNRGPSSEALNIAISTLKAKAWRNGTEFKLQNRTAEFDGSFWYDLADKYWRAVRVNADGWEIVDRPPILFNRYSHQQPQPEPMRDGDIKRLLDFINLKDENGKIMFLVSVVTSFIPDIAHSIFVFHGSEGTGKSLTSRVTRGIIDPSASPTCKCYYDMKEFIQHMAHNYMIILDNLSNISKSLSDTICSAVTGDGNSKRKLYTDDDDQIYNFKRLFIINGINNVATEADLLRRSVLYQLEQLPNEKRKEERVFWQEFEEARPYILGGVFNTLSKAMRLYPEVKLNGLYSLADYTKWGYAVAEALGFGGDAFLAAYADNQGIQNDEAIENHPVALALTLLIEKDKNWEGKAADLLDTLAKTAEAEKINTKSKNWPQSASALSRQLNIVQTVLSKKGIEIEKAKKGSNRIITVKSVNGEIKAGSDDPSKTSQDAKSAKNEITLFNSSRLPCNPKRTGLNDWSTIF